MRCNVGKTDQVIRIILGIFIILICIYYNSWWGILGLALIVTGITRYCPLNKILKISTCDKSK